MSSVGSSSKGRGNGTASIPPASKKMIDSLKEIVNCPDHEIYAMLKECNMDPNDTVNRLLSQDPFHEVKSKREKRKENKDSTDSRPRGLSSSSNRGGKGTGRSSLNQFSSTDSGGIRGRPAHKKENGGTILPNYASTTFGGVAGNNVNHKPMSLSDSAPTDTTGSMLNLNDGPSLPSQLPSGYQPAWTAVPGQISMADIVRRGRPQSKPPSISFSEPLPQSGNFPPVSTPLPTESHHDHNSSEVPASAAHDVIHEPGIAAKGSIMPEPSVASANCEDPASSSNLHNEANLYLNSQLDEVQESEDNATVENLAATSERQMQMDDAFHSQRQGLERQEDYSVTSSVEDASVAESSAAANLQQLSLGKEDMDQPTTAEDFPAVIIPNHLQVPTADCSHLSFGSFGCSMNATFSGTFEPKTPKSNLEESNLTSDSSSVEQPDAQNNEYYEDDELRSTSNENVGAPTSSQPEVIKHAPPTESTHGHQYTFPSVPGYGFENTAQANAAAYSYTQTNSQMQNLTPFPSAMQPYTNALPSNILASQVQPGRESDLPYMSFLATPSMPTKYSSAMSSISAPTMSMPEGVKPGAFSIAQSNSQTLPSTNVPGGPALPQHLPLHPYSQPTLPLGHFANMIGYPFLHHSYTYLPYAAAGNSAFHQSPAAIHSAAGIKYSVPQYKNSVSVSSLPQSATIPSGYAGGYGSSGSIPGNFNLNPSTPASTIGYEDVISSQYKENSNYVSLQQQNEGSAMWVHGHGSRSMSPLPASTYYSIQGQNQPSGFRQGQQQSPYGALGYPNFYHSQAGATQEHHQQTPGEGTLSTSQGAPSQQSHQIWQHSY